jgi:hypothetical protein
MRRLSAMSVGEVGELLRNLNLGDFAPGFEAESIDGATLAECDEEDLAELGISFKPKRKKLLKALKKYVEDVAAGGGGGGGGGGGDGGGGGGDAAAAVGGDSTGGSSALGTAAPVVEAPLLEAKRRRDEATAAAFAGGADGGGEFAAQSWHGGGGGGGGGGSEFAFGGDPSSPLRVRVASEHFEVVWELMPPDAMRGGGGGGGGGGVGAGSVDGCSTLAFALLPTHPGALFDPAAYGPTLLHVSAAPLGAAGAAAAGAAPWSAWRELPGSPFELQPLPPAELMMPGALTFVSAVDGAALSAPAVQLADSNGYSRDAKVFSGTTLPVPSIWHSAAVRATPAMGAGFDRESVTLVNLPKMTALAPPMQRLFLMPTPRAADDFGRPLPAAREQPLHVLLHWGTPGQAPPARPSDLDALSLHCITSKGEHIS